MNTPRRFPKIHRFDSSGEAYNMSQCLETIKDGDVLSVPNERVVGVLIEAWPVAISENTGVFEIPAETLDWAAIPATASNYKETSDYSESFKLAVDELNDICWEATKKKWDEEDFHGFYHTYPMERKCPKDSR